MTGDASTPRQSWDRVAAGWQTWWETIERPAHAVTERLLALASVAPGHRVLNIATGVGEPALSAARRVGPTGQVVATDLSPQMLTIARERALASGLSNVEFLEADAAHLDLPGGSFNAILCRWGVTSLPDPFATLQTIRRLLTPNGAFATAVWEAGPTGRPLAELASALAEELFDGPLSRARTPAHVDSAKETLANDMKRAGFTAVQAVAMTIVLAWRSPADCVQYLLDVSPDLGARLASQTTAQRVNYRQQLEARLGPYVTVDGSVHIPNETICAAGRR